MPKLTVQLYQALTGRGIIGGEVFLFEGAGPVESPEDADYSGRTDFTGAAVFDVSGFFRVGVRAPGRYAADPAQEPPEDWRRVWSAWGAVGVARDITYPFPLKWKLLR